VTEVSWSVAPDDQSSRHVVLVLGRTDEQQRLTAALAAADAILPVAGQSGTATDRAANTASTDINRRSRSDSLGNASLPARDSALGHGGAPRNNVQRVTIMTTAYHAQPSLASDTLSPTAAWAIDAVASLRGNRALYAAAHDARSVLSPAVNTPPLRGLTVLRGAEEQPLVAATEQRVGQQVQLHLMVSDEVPAVLLATLIAAARNLNVAPTPDAPSTSRDELEWDSIADSTLSLWQRATREAASADPSAAKATAAMEQTSRAERAGDAASKGRWLWAVVLLLMLMETLVRKRTSLDSARA
jgi:hypothetical protein